MSSELGRMALAEMRRRDEERGIDPSAREPATVIEQPAPPAPPFVIEPPDWDREHRDFQARERAARVAEAASLLEPVEAPERPTAPAPRSKRWRRAPA